MVIFKEAATLSNFLLHQKNDGKKIGFVPTMGALHKGHLSLIDQAKKENAVTACSIFVNPTQFNNPEDFKHYPVTIEKDIEALTGAGCDVLFLPSVAEIYPAGHQKKQYELGDMERLLEGKYRPGHFQGVCQVVDRLLEIVQPHNLYLGQKDFQQCMVIKKLLKLTQKDDDIKLNIIPTMREDDGLAMSSRNMRLDEEQRRKAAGIYHVLQFIKNNLPSTNFDELKAKAKDQLEKKGFAVDYVEIAASENLHPVTQPSPNLVALIAASLGNIRLIDNLVLR